MLFKDRHDVSLREWFEVIWESILLPVKIRFEVIYIYIYISGRWALSLRSCSRSLSCSWSWSCSSQLLAWRCLLTCRRRSGPSSSHYQHWRVVQSSTPTGFCFITCDKLRVWYWNVRAALCHITHPEENMFHSAHVCTIFLFQAFLRQEATGSFCTEDLGPDVIFLPIHQGAWHRGQAVGHAHVREMLVQTSWAYCQGLALAIHIWTGNHQVAWLSSVKQLHSRLLPFHGGNCRNESYEPRFVESSVTSLLWKVFSCAWSFQEGDHQKVRERGTLVSACAKLLICGVLTAMLIQTVYSLYFFNT